MKTTNTLFILFTFLLLFSCEKNSKKTYELVKSDKSLRFPLERDTKNSILFLAPYTDKYGKEYLTFQNQIKNEILFYDINTSRFEFKITPEMEGSNGVGRFLGYYIHNLDSIYLTSCDFQEIALIDKNSNVKSKIEYEKAEDGTPLSFFCFITHYYRPATIIDRKMYIYSGADRWIDKDPVAAVLDLDTESIKALPFIYPDYPGSDNKKKKFGLEEEYSRCFDGKRFIYSFYYDENIYVASPEHDSVYQVKVKSKYIDKVKWLAEFGVSPKEACENPNYGNLLYDQYREVYYRIVYPATEINEKKEKVRSMELLEYGRKNFSIIILDKEFKILGETMFPDYSYNPKLIIIRKDGLYISDSHYMNPEFDDDILSFKKFNLK